MTETISRVLFDVECPELIVCPAVQIDVDFDVYNGVVNVTPHGAPSGFIGISLDGGELSFDVYESSRDLYPSHSFKLTEDNKIVAVAGELKAVCDGQALEDFLVDDTCKSMTAAEEKQQLLDQMVLAMLDNWNTLPVLSMDRYALMGKVKSDLSDILEAIRST